MGIYTDYMNQRLSFEQINLERKVQLKKISKLRDRDILVYAADLSKPVGQQISILPKDLMPFQDQLSYVKTKNIDIILETPGGYAEVVEDMVKLLRDGRFDRVGIIVPGTAKSAGTIFTMAGDEILMGEGSALGPIDAQVGNNGKPYSADAFLDGLEKIKHEVTSTGKLNPTYIPMLQNVSPGEIQHCENAQKFSKSLVKNWLANYKFKYWETHRSSGAKVTIEEKEARANEIAGKLCKHSDWLTHGRSIRLSDLQKLRLEIFDYRTVPELNDCITKYYTLLRMTFDMSNYFKIFETKDTQINQTINLPTQPMAGQHMPMQLGLQKPLLAGQQNQHAIIEINCPRCANPSKIQLNLNQKSPVIHEALAFPIDDVFVCPNCQMHIDLKGTRLQIEAQTGLKAVL